MLGILQALPDLFEGIDLGGVDMLQGVGHGLKL
jgi:hypothetical protein